MTLILGARGRQHVVLMADGFSIEISEDKTRVAKRDLTKLFGVEGVPVVIGHFGVNRLGALPVADVIEQEAVQDAVQQSWRRGLNVTAAKVIAQLDAMVAPTLKSHPLRSNFGLWLAGLWPCTDIPEVIEIYWNNLPFNRVRVQMKSLGDLSVGGSGLKYLRDLVSKPLDGEYEMKKIFESPPEYSMEYLKRLYDRAQKGQAKAKEELFGGTRKMALITADGVDLGAG